MVLLLLLLLGMKKLGVLLAVELCEFENEFVVFFFFFRCKEFMIFYDKIITLIKKEIMLQCLKLESLYLGTVI